MPEMIKMAEKEKVVYNDKDFKTSEHAIILRTKALIGRNLYQNETFYMIINDLNPPLKKAIQMLQDGSFDTMKLAFKDFK
jgi:carboxyl-terminal processing protease